MFNIIKGMLLGIIATLSIQNSEWFIVWLVIALVLVLPLNGEVAKTKKRKLDASMPRDIKYY